jgi:hypothetical protein
LSVLAFEGQWRQVEVRVRAMVAAVAVGPSSEIETLEVWLMSWPFSSSVKLS